MDQHPAERRPTEFIARCVSRGRSSDAELMALAPEGCLVELAEPILNLGDPVRVKIPGVSSLDGKTVWSEGTQAEIAFTVSLHPAVVNYIAAGLDRETADGALVPPFASAR